jgi:hypothetical protein
MRGIAVAMVAGGALLTVAPVALATGGQDHKEVICHPVNGRGETGYGWDIIDVDKASSHFNDDGTPKHTSSDGRTDTYSLNGLCPGAPAPTVTVTELPTVTVTVTGEPTTATETVPGPQSTVTVTGEPTTATETAPGPQTTVTVTGEPTTATATATGPTVTLTQTGPPSTKTATVAGPVSTAFVTKAGTTKTIVRDGKESLAFTGMDIGLASIGAVLFGAGFFLLVAGRRIGQPQ